MSKALIKTGPKTRGIVPAVASAIIPGLGQALNGQFEKGIVVFGISFIAGASMLKWIPMIGVIAGITWVYGVVDGYLTGKRKR